MFFLTAQGFDSFIYAASRKVCKRNHSNSSPMGMLSSYYITCLSLYCLHLFSYLLHEEYIFLNSELIVFWHGVFSLEE